MLIGIKSTAEKIPIIDIHSHLIFNVDDGASSIKESMRMVLEAEKIGVQAIVATPHFNEELYNSSDIDNNFNELNARVKDCDIKLFQGYEVFLTELTPNNVKHKGYLTLNRGRYLLFELPFDHVPKYIRNVLDWLNFHNYTPVLAHPERNRSFVRDFNKFTSVVELGCLVQVDAASIIGVYGAAVKNFAKNLIKMDLVHCIASDAHYAGDYMEWYVPAYNQVKIWSGQKTARKLFYDNPKIVVYG